MNEGHEYSLPGRFAVFSAKNGKPDVVARFEDDDVWLTQKHLAIVFNTLKQLISHHIKNIIESGELDAGRTVKKYLTVQSEGGREIGRHVDHYNLDMVIALGYRIDSPVAIAKAESEFEIYRAREMRQLKSDFDKAIRGYLPGMGEGAK